MVIYGVKVHQITNQSMVKKTIYLFRGHYPKPGVFEGVTSKDEALLKKFRGTSESATTFVVTATSQDALPPDKEINEIMNVCPCLVFPGGMKLGLGGKSKRRVDLRDLVTKQKATVVYVDADAELCWGDKCSIKMTTKAMVFTEDISVVFLESLVPETLPGSQEEVKEVVGSDS